MTDSDDLWLAWRDEEWDREEFSDYMECNSLMHAELGWPEGPWM